MDPTHEIHGHVTRRAFAPSYFRHATSLGGLKNSTTIKQEPCMLSPHKHVLILGLPAFLQCRTYLASRETAVFMVMCGPCMSPVVEQFSWPGCARTQVHMSARLLFTNVCMRHAATRLWSTGSTTFLHTHVQFYEEHNTAFLAVKFVTIAAALFNYIVSDPFEPTMHHSAFMRFRA
jgi:hypothetical protein